MVAACWLVGWLAGWLLGGLAGWLAGRNRRRAAVLAWKQQQKQPAHTANEQANISLTGKKILGAVLEGCCCCLLLLLHGNLLEIK